MKKPNKEKCITLLCTSAFAASGLFLFGPIQIYIHNLTEMWFPFTAVVFPSTAAFALAVCFLSAMGLLFSRGEKVFRWYICFLLGLGLALYVQGNLLPSDYGILNGAEIDWSAHSREMAVNAVVWAICLVIPFAAAGLLKKHFLSAARGGSIALFLVQTVAVVFMICMTDFSLADLSDCCLSDKGLYEVSDEQNVVIFILDAFDQDFFEQAREESPEITDFMDGFTYFSNVTSVYSNTQGSIPYLLTGQGYKNEQEYRYYVTDAWENGKEYYDILDREGFDLGLYTAMDIAVSEKAEKEWIDNAEMGSIRPSSYLQLEGDLLHLSAINYFPDALKKNIWLYDNAIQTEKTVKGSEYTPFVSDNTKFFDGLANKGLTITEGKKYRFIHLQGTHPPYTTREDLTQGTFGIDASPVTEAKAALHIVEEYVRQMKELGVYDQTCMILTADHGDCDYIKTSPILFVKGFNDRGALEENGAPVSHSDLRATILDELGVEEAQAYGKSVFEIKDDREDRRLYYQYTLEHFGGEGIGDETYFPDIVEFYVLSESNEPKSFIQTGKTYTPNGLVESTPYQYNIGETLYFTGPEALSYFVYGMTYINLDQLAWSGGNSGQARFYFGEGCGDLTCHIKLFEYVPNDHQRVTISSDGRELYSSVITSDMPYINFAVPADCIHEGMLVLDFSYPDAVVPASQGTSTDIRKIAIAFEELCFTEQAETEQILFAQQAGNGTEYVYSGWHGQEPELCWTDKSASLLAVLPKDRQQMTIDYWTHSGAKDTAVYYNDEYIGTLPHHDGLASETLVLPEEYQADGAAQLITFVTDGATSSKAVFGDDNPDERILGIAVSKVSFRPANVVGRTILFSEDEALSYFTSGTEHYLELDGLWTIGTHCEGRFYVKEPDKALACHIELYDWMPGGKQQVKIVSHGETLYDGTVTGETPYIDFAVPVQCVEDGYLDLEFTLPDACSPKSLGESEDARDLGIRFKSILFTEEGD